MRKLLVSVSALALLTIMVGDVEAGCSGGRGRLFNGRFLDRLRNREGGFLHRTLGPRHEEKKPDGKVCPGCKPTPKSDTPKKGAGEVDGAPWQTPAGITPEQLKMPREAVSSPRIARQ